MDLNRVQFGNVANADTVQGDVHRAAQRYMAGRDLPELRSDMSHVVMPHRVHMALGEHLHDAPSWDSSPHARASYDALEEETWRQYDAMTSPRSRGGLGLSAHVTPHDPYGRSDSSQQFADRWQNIIPEAKQDVGENNRIQALSTASTGGGHSFRNQDTNDVFRAVHDLFGHLGANRGVDRHGEEGAYQHHRQMYSPLARPALSAQLREQVGYLARYNDFPEQKGVLGYDSGPLQPHQFGEDYAALRRVADAKSREQRLL